MEMLAASGQGRLPVPIVPPPAPSLRVVMTGHVIATFTAPPTSKKMPATPSIKPPLRSLMSRLIADAVRLPRGEDLHRSPARRCDLPPLFAIVRFRPAVASDRHVLRRWRARYLRVIKRCRHPSELSGVIVRPLVAMRFAAGDEIEVQSVIDCIALRQVEALLKTMSPSETRMRSVEPETAESRVKSNRRRARRGKAERFPRRKSRGPSVIEPSWVARSNLSMPSKVSMPPGAPEVMSPTLTRASRSATVGERDGWVSFQAEREELEDGSRNSSSESVKIRPSNPIRVSKAEVEPKR